MNTSRVPTLVTAGVLALGLCAGVGVVDTAADAAVAAPRTVANAGVRAESHATATGSRQTRIHEPVTIGKHKKKRHHKKHQDPGNGTDSPAVPDAGTPPGAVPGGGSPNTSTSPGGGTPGTDPSHTSTPPPHSGPGGVKPLAPPEPA